MRHHVFTSSGNSNYKVAILIKNTSFNKQDLLKNYVNPLVAKGISLDQVIAFTLTYNEEGKAPVKLIKAYLEDLLPELEDLGVTHLYVADANYFKVLTRMSKAEPYLGYVLECAYEKYSFKVALGLNHQALIYNPDLQPKLELSLDVLASELGGSYQALGADIIHSCWYPEDLRSIAHALDSLHQYPSLTCDIETFSLRFNEAGIGTIAFAWDEHNGLAFCCDWYEYAERPTDEFASHYGYQQANHAVRGLLKQFFTDYKGTLIWHNASFDVKINIATLWMEDLLDREGLYKGLQILTRSIEDTKIIAYLATNSCAGNNLGLKALAHEFAGNWAVEEIKDIRKLPRGKLLQYNTIDALCTWFVYKKYHPKMVEDQQEHIYTHLFKPAIAVLLQTELIGMPMHAEQIKAARSELEAKEAEYLKVLKSSPTIQEYNLVLRQQAMEKANAKLKKKQHPLTAFDDVVLNPNSGPQLQRLLYEYMQLPVLDTTDTGLPATGGDTLKKLIHHTQNQEYLEVLHALVGLAGVSKILSAFIPNFEAAIDKGDGRVWLHGSFNLGGTVSGRLSSCVASWTPIATQRGLVPISEIRVGDYVWTHKRRWKPVENVILKPVTSMVDVLFCNGYTLTCTTAHKLRLPNGEWKTVKEIINERIEIVDAEPRKHFGSNCSISKRSSENAGANCRGSGYYVPECQPCVEEPLTGSRVSSSQSFEVLRIEGGRTQSNEGQNQGTASQLDRGMLGSERLPDCNPQRCAAVCSSCGNGKCFGFGDSTGTARSPSYRRESIEQCVGQLGFGNESGTHENSFSSSDVSCGKIAAINYRGDLPVWDITVADDHSYWAEGCFNHNSSPNLQQLPSGSDYGKLIKSCFSAPTGWIMVGADYNALEDRINTLLTKDPNKIKVFVDGYDSHCLRASKFFPEKLPGIVDTVESVNSIKKLFPEIRQLAKSPAFALQYAGTWITLHKTLGFSEEEAKKIEQGYRELYKVSEEWVDSKIQLASKQGYVDLAFGLRLRTPLLHQVIWGGSRVPGAASAEARTLGNAVSGQSYGLLNTRAANEFMQKVWASQYRYDVLPCAQIHDAQYYLVRDDVSVVEWVNRELIASMRWQELPEIQHDLVKLGGEMDLFYKGWHQPITLPNSASQEEIMKICKEGVAEYDKVSQLGHSIHKVAT